MKKSRFIEEQITFALRRADAGKNWGLDLTGKATLEGSIRPPRARTAALSGAYSNSRNSRPRRSVRRCSCSMPSSNAGSSRGRSARQPEPPPQIKTPSEKAGRR